MTTPAYPETYLDSAQTAMGEAFDYAVNDCGLKGEAFVRILRVSPVSARIENGEPAYLSGKSGIELARAYLRSAGLEDCARVPRVRYARTAEYWCGWAIAYYQWKSCRRYGEIFSAISYDDLRALYPTLHEADVTKFAEVVDGHIRRAFPETNLRRLRVRCRYSQSELARLSGVRLRSIQMYEQRRKDINKASVATIWNLAKVFGCPIESLIEK